MPWHFPTSEKSTLCQDLPLCCRPGQHWISSPWQLTAGGVGYTAFKSSAVPLATHRSHPRLPLEAAGSWRFSLLPLCFPASENPTLLQDLPICCTLGWHWRSSPWQLTASGGIYRVLNLLLLPWQCPGLVCVSWERAAASWLLSPLPCFFPGLNKTLTTSTSSALVQTR